MADHGDDNKHKPEGGGGGGHGGGGQGHGGEDHEEHEGAPEWLISFADNVALMMGFFVIMLALQMAEKASTAPSGSSPTEGVEGGQAQAQQLDWVLGVREAFNNPVSISSTKPEEQALVRRLRQRLREQADDDGAPGDRERVQSLARGQHYDISGEVLFDHNSAELSDAGRGRLVAVVDKIKGLSLIVEVRAHTSAAESVNKTDRGMRLSFDRAMAVAEHLVKMGLEWKQIRLVACADNDRVQAMAYDTQQQEANRRVEVIVREELVKP